MKTNKNKIWAFCRLGREPAWEPVTGNPLARKQELKTTGWSEKIYW
jgi:hypothetical protein